MSTYACNKLGGGQYTYDQFVSCILNNFFFFWEKHS